MQIVLLLPRSAKVEKTNCVVLISETLKISELERFRVELLKACVL